MIHLGLMLTLCASTDLRASDRTNGQAEAIMAALRARDFDTAVQRSREAVRTAPNDPQLWTLHGIALANQGNRTEALEAFERALTISPNYYGPSPWDVPHRLSMTVNYMLPSAGTGNALRQLTSGWGVGAISIYQSGYPMTVWTTAPFSAGGDCNADGDNLDYPNVASYDMRTSLNDYLNNVFSPGQFTAPPPGSEGNQRTQQFRQPSFAETDVSLYKNTKLTGHVNFLLRFEFYNLFNRKNLYLENDLTSAGFGKAISQQLPRWWQIGARLTF
jgi:tetratricopeptide (TPR) repeat protein